MIKIETDGHGRMIIVTDENNGASTYSLIADLLTVSLADGAVRYAGGRLGELDVLMVRHFLKQHGQIPANPFVGEPA